MKFSTNEINKILGLINLNGSLKNNLIFNRVSIDSRKLFSDDLFLAIEGERYDGHDFLNEVIEKGIKAVVINQGKQKLVPKNVPFWLVPNTKEAFLSLALFKRKKLNIPVVAITGSVGKTTTKEIASEVLRNYGNIKVSDKNFNNEIGVGLTIHSCDGSEKLLVLEMGMRGRGQIEILSKFSEPDIAVITNIGSAHIGILGSKDSIARAKCEITKFLNPKGVVIIPYGDPLLNIILKENWRGKVLQVKVVEKKLYKENSSLKENYLLGIYDSSNNTIEVNNKIFDISLKGIHNAVNFLYVYAISTQLGIKFDDYNSFVFKSIEGRNNLVKTSKLTILDESYNASPESVKACIKLLLEFPGRHFMAFGSMRELGRKSIKYHEEIFQIIKSSDIQKCFFICDDDLKANLKNSVLNDEKILISNNLNHLVHLVNKMTIEGDYILIKGSRYWELDKIIPLIN
tara:strand:+ start:482 stop:1855 length:1374 start_codon:yes stop_codon:yes gene_type:complete